MIGIDTHFPTVKIIIEAHYPRTKQVACLVGIFSITGICTTWEKRIPKRFPALVCWHLFHLSIWITEIRISIKKCRHLHPQLQAPWAKPLLAAYLQITRLAMIEHFVGIFLLLVREIMLPTVISHHTIGNMSFQLHPAIEYRQGPIIRQGKANLGNRAGIDSQGLATAGKRLILEFHRIFLGTHTQHTMQPASLNKCLLHNGMAGIINRSHHIYTITQSPTTGRIGCERAIHHRTQIAIPLIERTQAILVGIEPKWSLPLR